MKVRSEKLMGAKSYFFTFEGGGWAEFTINDDSGLFAVHSDWGHGHHYWPSRDGATMVEELLRFEPDYIMRKFAYEKKKTWEPDFDPVKTEKAMLEHIEEARFTEEDYKEVAIEQMHDLIARCDDLGVVAGIEGENGYELLQAFGSELYEFLRYEPSYSYTHFKEKLIPWFQGWLKGQR